MNTPSQELRKSMDLSDGPDEFSRGVGSILANSHDELEVRQLYVEWAIDQWCHTELKRYIKVFEQCFEKLTNLTDWFEYNDMDNYGKVVSWGEGFKAIAHEDQNLNFVFVEGREAESEFVRTSFTIYRYWKMCPEDDLGYGPEAWSDCPNGKYGFGPERPTIDWLLEHQGTKYNDCRDEAWVAALSRFKSTIDGNMIHRYTYFTHALFNLRGLLDALEREK